MKKKWIKLSVIPCILSTLLFSCTNSSNPVLPETQKDQDTILHLAKKNVNEVEPLVAVFASLGKLEAYSSYQRNSETIFNLSKDMVMYTPYVNSLQIKSNGAYYQEIYTDNSLFSSHHVAYMKDMNIAIQNGNDYYCVSASDYNVYYGLLPNKLLSNYILNNDTIQSIQKNDGKDGTYTFVLELNSKATSLYKKQKERFYGFKSEIEYISNPSFTLTMKEDFSPLSCTIKEEYYVDLSSYSHMKCSEITSTQFSRYQENIAIPNEARLEATLFETPKDILNKNQSVYMQRLMMAIMQLDLKNGVLLAGNIPSEDNVKATIQAHFKADVLNISKDPLNAFEGCLQINSEDKNLMITYKDSVIYIQYGENKYAFNVDTIMNIISLIRTLNSSMDSIEIEKVSGLNEAYRIILKEDILESFNDILLTIAHLLGVELTSPSLELIVSLTGGNISNIRLQIASNDVSLGIDFSVKNQKYFALDDLDTYATKIEQSYQVSLSLAALAQQTEVSSDNDTLNGELYFGMNLLESRVEDMFKLYFDFHLSVSLQNLVNEAFLKKIFNDEVYAILDVNYGRIFYHEGKAYISLYKDTELRYFKEITLFTEEVTNHTEETKNTLFMDLLDILLSTSLNKEDDGIHITISGVLIDKIIKLLLNESLSDALIHHFGQDVGQTLIHLFLLNKPLDHVSLFLSNDKEKESTLDVWRKDDGAYDEAQTQDLLCSLSLRLLSIDKKEKDFSFDAQNDAKKEAKAAQMRNKIDELKKSFSLSDEYYQKLQKANNEYLALANDIKVLVYNGETIGYFENQNTTEYLMKKYTTQKQEVNEFLSAWDSMSLEDIYTKIKFFTKAQQKYIETSFETQWNQYYEYRLLAEQTTVKEIGEKLDKITFKNVETLADDELYDQLMELTAIEDQIDTCLNESISSLDLDTFYTYSRSVLAEIVNRFISYSKNAVKLIKENDKTKFSSISSAIGFYEEMNAYYEKYYDQIKLTSLYNKFQSEFSNYELEAEFFDYYRAYEWDANMISLIEQAIHEVLNKEEVSQEEEEAIQKALTYVDTKCVSNYQEWVDYLNKTN